MTPFVWKSRIRFVDTDASQRIHYSALFRHFEIAEDEFFRHIGHPYPLRGPGVSYPRVHVEADYLRALWYDDEVEVAVWVDRAGRSSYTLGFGVCKDGVEAARGKITVVCMNLETQRAQEMPEDLVAAIRRYLRE
jgi:YbgC/YbaW family acyl-CoA thioester hydrolase